MSINGNFGAAERKPAEVPQQTPAKADGATSTPAPAKAPEASAKPPLINISDGSPTPASTVSGDGHGAAPSASSSKYSKELFTESEIARLEALDAEENKSNQTQGKPTEGNKPDVNALIEQLPEEMREVLKSELKRKEASSNIFRDIEGQLAEDEPLRAVTGRLGGKLGEIEEFRQTVSEDMVKMGQAYDSLQKVLISREVEFQIADARREFAGRCEFNDADIRTLALSGKMKLSPTMVSDYILKRYRDRITNADIRRGREAEADNQRRLGDAASPGGSGNVNVLAEKPKSRQELLKEVADGLRERHGIKEPTAMERVSANISGLFGRRKSA